MGDAQGCFPCHLRVTLSPSKAEGRTPFQVSERGMCLSPGLELQGEDLFSTSPRPAGKSGHVSLENNEEQ